MNTVFGPLHPYQNYVYLGLGLSAAVAGIWISAAVEMIMVQGIGFLMLAPAGLFMAIGLCRSIEGGRKSGKLALPPIPAALRRDVSVSRAIRVASLSLARAMGGGAGKSRASGGEVRPPSWTE